MAVTQRSHLRILVALKVAEAAHPERSWLTRNLSMGGMFMLSDRRWPMGSLVDLVLEYKGAQIPTPARVTHLQPDGVGVRFVQPTVEFEDEITRVIDDLVTGGRPLDQNHSFDAALGPTHIVWRAGNLEHAGEVTAATNEKIRCRTGEAVPAGTPLFVLLPTKPVSPELAYTFEIVGAPATVTRTWPDGFDATFGRPSAEFRVVLDRLVKYLRAQAVGS